MSEVSPKAAFDALFVADRINRSTGPVSLDEIQVFIYLACLLALYDGKPVSKWGYGFLATPASSPFSVDLFNAIESLKAARLFSPHDEKVVLSLRGQDELAMWCELDWFADRVPYLEGATGASAAMPVSSVKAGVILEPDISRAVALDVPKELLEDPEFSEVYEQFKVLRTSLGDAVPDHMVPAVVWLSFLLEQADAARR
ncbi:hypothetical protein ETD86_32825 [Nonomuraea turkmeniaca]|uniref:DUF4065 domain-containing protein n=1 Tax=Nonomuraea turkmeniaca TaxID=103838 RepID=A0A5S4F831_9ACTN|nr:hypothetical protein [Nonomuraea turkmeniaca]TMR12368.1 hypothetical protein ETD86_32825 [Nonomuraea turkmeniaca]